MSEQVEISSYQGGPSEIDSAVDAFIKEAATKYKYEEPGEAVTEAPAEVAPQIPPGASKEAQENTVAEPPKVEDRGIERIVEREVALRAKEQAIFAREEQMRGMEEKIKAMEARMLPPDLIDRFEYSPEDALKAMGLDPDQVVRQVIANRLGPEADPSIKNTVENSKMKREMAELRAELRNHQMRIQAQEFVTKVQTEAREYISKGTLEQDAPTVASVAKSNPDRVHREIMEEISRDAQVKAQRDPNGAVLSFDEAAKRVEARWSEFKGFFSPSTPAQPQTSMPTREAIVPKPANPSTSSPGSTTKPPERPLAPWLQRKDVEEEGIKAAIAVFNKGQG